MSAQLPDIKTNFAEWYNEVIYQTELIDMSPTRGCFVFRPYGFAIWENIQKELDKKIKGLGAQNAYFPLLIPDSFLRKEQKHIEGFSPELAVVTHGGGKELEEKLVVRPTSETIIYHMFARWITSWRDLPLKVNQWANVVRWEMRTRPFVRSLEFLWQEGHTAHATHQEALDMTLAALNVYKDIYENLLAVPVIPGQKTPHERFAGAERTYTIESLMQDGKALQMCTSHLLDHSFPASFDIAFQATDGTQQVPYCTSWGFTTRSIGGLIMMHGDQTGLVMPPRIAPIQAVIVPIFKTDEERALVCEEADKIQKELQTHGFSVTVDNDASRTPGAKFYHWEMRGVPVRIELGPRDLQNDQVVFVNRIEQDKAKKKTFIKKELVATMLKTLLDAIHDTMFQAASARMKANWFQADNLADFGKTMADTGGLFQTGWCGDEACELKAKEYQGSIRCVYPEKKHATCFVCGKPSPSDVLVAKAY